MPRQTKAKQSTNKKSNDCTKEKTKSKFFENSCSVGSDDEFEDVKSPPQPERRTLASKAGRKVNTRQRIKNGYVEAKNEVNLSDGFVNKNEENLLSDSPAAKLRKLAKFTNSIENNSPGEEPKTKSRGRACNARKNKETVSPYFAQERKTLDKKSNSSKTGTKSPRKRTKVVKNLETENKECLDNVDSSVQSKRRKTKAAKSGVDDVLQAETTSEPAPSTEPTEDEDSDSSDSCWEEVEDLPSTSTKKEAMSTQAVQFTVEDTSGKRKKKSRMEKVQEYFRREFNRMKKETKENIHKVHLLCLVARGFYLKKMCSHELLVAQALSIIPVDFTNRPIERFELATLDRLVKWFWKVVTLNGNENSEENDQSLEKLSSNFETRMTTSLTEYVFMFYVVMVTLGADVRLVMSLQPIPFKEPSKKQTSKPNSPSGKKVNNNSKTSEKQNVQKSTDADSSYGAKKIPGSKNKLARKCASKVEAMIDDSGDEEELTSSDKKKLTAKEKKDKKNTNARRSKSEKNHDATCDVSSDSDFETEVLSPRSSKSSKSPKSPITKSQEEETKTGVNQWIEVYLPSEKKWICIDCIHGSVDQPGSMERHASQPVSYVLGFDNEGSVKDLTSRYAARWMYQTRKTRIDQDWWSETLSAYKTSHEERDEEEDECIKARLLSQPFPTSIADFKNHPLYALTRHLLKFECLYPETAVPLGFMKSEPIYARECIRELHSRETWLKEARTVRIGEKPYKMVKPRPKPHKPLENTGEATLELYGQWQTEDYQPPVAVDGKVPRNEYGNVEMFKPCMLPVGTVHLKIPGLNKVARKVGIDCAPAMTGWDFHGGYCHSVIDGYIVCEEMKDTLMAAWEEEQQITEHKEAEKREKRVLSNWTSLVRGLMIRERLEKRYDLQKKPELSSAAQSEKAVDVEVSWPRNRESKYPTTTKKDSRHLFPFEKL